jgi:hypothetical protein
MLFDKIRGRGYLLHVRLGFLMQVRLVSRFQMLVLKIWLHETTTPAAHQLGMYGLG